MAFHEAGEAVRAAGALGVPGERVIEALRESARRKPAGAKLVLAEFSPFDFHRYDLDGPWSLPLLIVGLESDDLLTRRLSAQEIGKYGRLAAVASAALLANIAREFPRERTTDVLAKWVEVNYHDPGSARPSSARRTANFDRAELVFFEYRSEYLWALSRMGPAAKDVLPRVVDIGLNGHLVLRPDAIRTAAMIDTDGAAALDLAQRQLLSPNPLIRLGAVDAIRMLGPKAKAALPKLEGLLEDPRPYEVDALFRAIEAVGPGPQPESHSGLVIALRKRDPDVSSAIAAVRLGLIGVADTTVIGALREGFGSKDPKIACLCALSLGRVGAPSAVPTLSAALTVDVRDRMDLWEAKKLACAIEALGRIGPPAAPALAGLGRIMRALQGRTLLWDRMAGLEERAVARAACLIRMPSYAIEARPVPDAMTRSDPPWCADWALDPPNPGVMVWTHQMAPDVLWMEYGQPPKMAADWSSGKSSAFDESMLLVVTRVAGGVNLRLIDWETACVWARQLAEPRPSARFALDAKMLPVDLEVAERIDLEFAARDMSAVSPINRRWRGGFSIPNPWRRR